MKPRSETLHPVLPKTAWQLRVPCTALPRWMIDLAAALARTISAPGEVFVTPSQTTAHDVSRRWAWRLDAALFGASRALAPVGVASSTLPVDSAALTVDLVSATAPAASETRGRQLLLLVEGMPAGRLANAVEHALCAGRGQVDIEAVWSEPGRPAATVVWHCGMDERSRHRSLDIVADKLIRLAAHVIEQLGAVANPLPRGAPDGAETFDTPGPTWRALRHAARRLLWVDQWAITVHQNVADDVLLPRTQGIDLIPPADRFWADPFLAREGGRLWVFFEEVLYATGRGHLACVSIDAKGEVSAPCTVLQENYHLSYPQVIRHAGHWYLLPESSANRSLVLYRADALPGPWRPVAELMTGLRVADATVHHDGNRWWITATAAGERGCLNDELHVFCAPALLGPWQPLANNPVRVDPASARPAGPWFRWKGRWVRPVQDCRLRYGRALQLLAVERIDESGVQEDSLGLLAPKAGGSIDCVHTYSRVGSDLAVDWLRWRRKGASKPLSGFHGIEWQPSAAVPSVPVDHAPIVAGQPA
jgi:hypothetical protein